VRDARGATKRVSLLKSIDTLRVANLIPQRPKTWLQHFDVYDSKELLATDRMTLAHLVG
jgi:hypothetical protein